MPRIQTPIRPLQIDYKCDICNQGFYRLIQSLFDAEPPQFLHECDNCGHQQCFTEKYPTIRYALEGQLLDLNKYVPSTF